MTLEDDYTVAQHLQEAMTHLETAIDKSIQLVLNEGQSQKEIGHLWEEFLGKFFGCVRQKGMENKVNVLGWIKFPRWRH